MTITTLASGHATVPIFGGKFDAHLIRLDSGKWQVRPEWELLTVGKFFPRFDTRKQAAQWAVQTYGGAD